MHNANHVDVFQGVKGKKLLVLGCTRADCQIIDAAREMGVYTIATDNHTDWLDAPAKYEADEAWDISWSDIDTLKGMCEEVGVDGVMAGFSEFRVACAIRLSEELGMPFYAGGAEVLEQTFDKKAFKDACRRCGVPVTRDFDYPSCGIDAVEFPVLVKPADNGGSRGIRACFSPKELPEAIEYALGFSAGDKIIVEELVQGAREVIVYYTIADGDVALSAMCDKYERDSGTGFGSLPDAYLYPSRYLSSYMKLHDEAVVRAIREMGIANGSVNLQGFARPDGTFVFFEMDHRPGGTCTFNFTEYFNGISYMKMLISYSLTGDMHPELLAWEDATFGGGCGLILTLLCKDGKIASQYGDEVARVLPGVLRTCFYHHEGSVIEVNGSQFPKAYRAFIAGEGLEEAIATAKKVQDAIHIEDVSGDSLLFERFDLSLLGGGR